MLVTNSICPFHTYILTSAYLENVDSQLSKKQNLAFTELRAMNKEILIKKRSERSFNDIWDSLPSGDGMKIKVKLKSVGKKDYLEKKNGNILIYCL